MVRCKPATHTDDECSVLHSSRQKLHEYHAGVLAPTLMEPAPGRRPDLKRKLVVVGDGAYL